MTRRATGKYKNNVRLIARFLGDAPDKTFTMLEIADALGMTPPRIWVSIKSLQKNGLVIEHPPVTKKSGKRYQGKAGAVLWGAG